MTARRLLGLDVARALAVVGMVMVHVGPPEAEGLGAAGRVYDLSHGRASILFVLLAGIGVTLLAERARSLRDVRWTLAWRAAILLPVGLALEPLDHGVLVILQYYAAYFLVALVVLRCADRTLLGLAAGVAVLGPVVRLALEQGQPAWFDVGPTALGDPAVVVVRNLVLAGSYPVVTWAAPLLLGLWLGRRDLRAAHLQRAMVVAGSGVAVLAAAVSWWLTAMVGEPAATPALSTPWAELASGRAHSEMPLWLIGATGAAVAVVGACLAAAERWPRTAWPLAAVGQLALTVYVGHLLVLDAWPGWLERSAVGPAVLSVLRLTAVVAVLAVAYRAVFARGPLEALLRLPARLHARARDPHLER